MKCVLLSVKPQFVAKILNKEKTIEVRKRFPIDYVGWVYIYVTKALPHLSKTRVGEYEVYDDTQWDKEWLDLNGKVVCRFWCDKVEEIACEQLDNGVGKDTFFYTESIDDIRKDSCLGTQELINYLGAKPNGEIVGKAIHITKLEIFDKPKEISEFSIKVFPHRKDNLMTRYLTRAPQSFCFIEV